MEEDKLRFGENSKYAKRKTSKSPDSYKNIYKKIKEYKFTYDFERLVTMSEEDSTEVIIDILSRKVDFSELFHTNLKPDWLVLIINILSKVCLSLYEENQIVIINLVPKDSFLRAVEKFLMARQHETCNNNNCAYFWKDVETFFTDLMVVCESVIKIAPFEVLSKFFPRLLNLVENCITSFEKNDEQFTDKMKLKLRYLLSKCELGKNGQKIELVDMTENFNPRNFRQLSVYPNRDDIFSENYMSLEKNIIDGEYDSVNHYLDVQFKLLKEDFIGPLRQNIVEYVKQNSKGCNMEFSNCRIHPGVTFHLPHILNNHQMGIILSFPIKNNLYNVFTRHSERLNYGSLLGFTKDNFSTILFGKIIKKDIKNGMLIVGFEPEHNYEYDIEYTMIECKTFYEPYYLVLKALQGTSENEFLMENYVIYVNPKTERLNYLNIPSCKYVIGGKFIDLLENEWPIPDSLPLNKTQYSAFKAALTQKFVVIQGPPGTGKTYLAHQIVKTYLHPENIDIWYNGSPILIISFTNHALDQFLEGLVTTTDQIVRVGCQSKNKNLNKYNLSYLRMNYIDDQSDIGKIYHSYKRNVCDLAYKIRTFELELKVIKSFESVLRFNIFQQIDENLENSWFAGASDAHILEWLLAEQESKNVHLQNLPDDGEDLRESSRYCEKDEKFEVYHMEKINLLSMRELYLQISKYKTSLKEFDSNVREDESCLEKWKLETDSSELSITLKYLTAKLQNGKSMSPPKKPNINYESPQHMHPTDRWDLYFYWLYLYQDFVTTQLVELRSSYYTEHRKYLEIRNMHDANLMKDMLVVGMTTTGAARLQSLLHTLKCRIVIVEEAAEVLESHVAVAISHHCEQVILLGDHQQLRPSTSDYRIGTDFNLGISMFERMVRNKIQCHVLEVQHRMRPEIAQLIVPHIYPKLENHHSVTAFPPVLGIVSSLYFIHHEHQEVSSEFGSKSNLHEAHFLLKLARYLIQNGYDPKDITILSAYSAQMFLMQDQARNYGLILQDVRITVIDNFQGEESKIILLSLVRNNSKRNIGFLKTENRICVALSRAKHGFYIMGNMDLLSENSQVWYKIKETLVKQNCLGNYLSIYCEVHRDNVTRIEKASDFDSLLPDGTCNRKCGTLMSCGHSCQSPCHLKDRLHKAVKCREPCLKVLCGSNHICQKMCYEKCGGCTAEVSHVLDCSHKHVLPCHVDPKNYKCDTLVTATLSCGHTIFNKPCYKNLEDMECVQKCGVLIKLCGHVCKLNCHMTDLEHKRYNCVRPCEKIAISCRTKTHKCPKLCYENCSSCRVIVERKLKDCNHLHSVICSSTAGKIKCMEPCDKLLSCGHQCKRKCHEICGKCQKMVPKILSNCGHEVMTKCCEIPNSKNCFGMCPKLLQCGHACKTRCNEPCTPECEELVDYDNSSCGHKFKVMCYLTGVELPNYSNKLLQYCKEPCSQILECSHKCLGTCGKCFQGRIHVICLETCGIPLVCGHECTSPCNEICQPCNFEYSVKCIHRTCKQKCGEKYTICRKKCSRRCKHMQCKDICGAKCTVAPCQKPCDKILSCSHTCTGFCGDPCPPICKICDKKKLPEIVFGYEDNDDTIFILLDECKHIIESKKMEILCKQNSNENVVQISYSKCPKCGILLTLTERYKDYIRETNNDMVSIQKKNYGNFFEREANLNELQEIFRSVEELHHILVFPIGEFTTFINQCSSLFNSIKNDRQLFSMFMGKSLEAKLSIVQCIGILLKRDKLNLSRRSKRASLTISSEAEDYLEILFKPLLGNILQITDQEILDLERELWRLQRIDQLIFISTKFETHDFIEIRELIYQPIVYTKKYDKQLKVKLLELYRKFKVPDFKDKQCSNIVKPMSLKTGSWFKCPNGHFFFISSHIDSNQISHCDKCREQTDY